MTMNFQENAAPTRTLYVMRAGVHLFAVYAAEVEASAYDLKPTRLPFAPPAVLGVVSLRGRIRTVIDPLRLDEAVTDNEANAAPDNIASDSASTNSNSLNSNSPNSDQRPPRFFVALAGDEQLALACDSAEEQFEIAQARINPPAAPRSHTRGTIERGGERIALLDPALLFEAAMRGTDRRRKRS